MTRLRRGAGDGHAGTVTVSQATARPAGGARSWGQARGGLGSSGRSPACGAWTLDLQTCEGTDERLWFSAARLAPRGHCSPRRQARHVQDTPGQAGVPTHTISRWPWRSCDTLGLSLPHPGTGMTVLPGRGGGWTSQRPARASTTCPSAHLLSQSPNVTSHWLRRPSGLFPHTPPGTPGVGRGTPVPRAGRRQAAAEGRGARVVPPRPLRVSGAPAVPQRAPGDSARWPRPADSGLGDLPPTARAWGGEGPFLYLCPVPLPSPKEDDVSQVSIVPTSHVTALPGSRGSESTRPCPAPGARLSLPCKVAASAVGLSGAAPGRCRQWPCCTVWERTGPLSGARERVG